MANRDLSLATNFTQTIDNTNYSASFGIKSGENVQMEDYDGSGNTLKFSLQDFYNNWKDFKNTAKFLWVSSEIPQSDWPDQIKVHYNPNWN